MPPRQKPTTLAFLLTFPLMFAVYTIVRLSDPKALTSSQNGSQFGFLFNRPALLASLVPWYVAPKWLLPDDASFLTIVPLAIISVASSKHFIAPVLCTDTTTSCMFDVSIPDAVLRVLLVVPLILLFRLLTAFIVPALVSSAATAAALVPLARLRLAFTSELKGSREALVRCLTRIGLAASVLFALVWFDVAPFFVRETTFSRLHTLCRDLSASSQSIIFFGPDYLHLTLALPSFSYALRSGH
jgi:hypothetical protein